MNPVANQDYPIQLSDSDISNVNRYRKLKETSILTIMFTDIKGFTEKTETIGESASLELLNIHDDLLVPIIEKDQAGFVVKHIGDAIMAVFSEPSVAVACAVAIQQELFAYNRSRDDDQTIIVRIGLHMGQVSIQNEVDFDLFGRHVNRASRVEGLADGGQIYMTYPVFDSARGWIGGSSRKHLAWKKHGSYFLKGIPDPVDIYEVADISIFALRPPRKGKKKKGFPSWILILLMVLLGILISFGLQYFKQTRVWMVDFKPDHVYFNTTREKLVFAEPPQSHLRQLTGEITPGQYLIYYTVSDGVRYYAPVKVKRGDNRIQAHFSEYRLPSRYRYLHLTPKNKFKNDTAVSEKFDYILFDKNNTETGISSAIAFSITGGQSKDTQGAPLASAPGTEPDEYEFVFQWNLTINGKTISRQEERMVSRKNDNKKQEKQLTLYSDEMHTYEIRYFAVRGNAFLEISARFR